MTKIDVINRISQLRTRANKSARALSLDIGKNGAYISRLESKDDNFEPSVSALLAIIEACGSTEAEFFYYDMTQYKKDEMIINLLKNASDIKKQAIIDLLKS